MRKILTLINQLPKFMQALLELVYPRICAACGEHLAQQEAVVCLVCTIRLPYTNFHKFDQNPLHKKFWGRINPQYIDSLLYLEKESKTQALLYLLKYHGRQDIGIYLAEQIVKRYLSHPLRQSINAIVCIPLHPLKLKKRGYNQCHSFSYHLSEAWSIPFYPQAIERIENSQSQTGNNRIDRWGNVANIFGVAKPKLLSNKHLLLIDDVVTTGATLEACSLQLLQVENTQLSILSMACKV